MCNKAQNKATKDIHKMLQPGNSSNLPLTAFVNINIKNTVVGITNMIGKLKWKLEYTCPPLLNSRNNPSIDLCSNNVEQINIRSGNIEPNTAGKKLQ